MPNRRSIRSTNFIAAEELLGALEEIACLLCGHLTLAASDGRQDWVFLQRRMEIIIRILYTTNRRLLNVVDLSSAANKLGRCKC